MCTVCCSGRLGADGGVWTEFLTHGCENITFPQLLLRTVIKRQMDNFGKCTKFDILHIVTLKD